MMKQDNVHPLQLKVLLGSLPVGGELVSVSVVNANQSEVIINRNGQEIPIQFEKTSASDRLGKFALPVEVTKGEPMDAVIQRFSEAYNIPLLKDVDYKAMDDEVTLNKFYHITLLETALFFKGQFIMYATPKEAETAHPHEVDLDVFKKGLVK